MVRANLPTVNESPLSVNETTQDNDAAAIFMVALQAQLIRWHQFSPRKGWSGQKGLRLSIAEERLLLPR